MQLQHAPDEQESSHRLLQRLGHCQLALESVQVQVLGLRCVQGRIVKEQQQISKVTAVVLKKILEWHQEAPR